MCRVTLTGEIMSTTTLVIVLACVVVALLVVAAVLAQQANRRRQLRQQFGPEYDRTVDATGGTKRAEIELRHTSSSGTNSTCAR